MIKKFLLLIIQFGFAVSLISCLESPCKDAVQLPIPILNFSVVDGKSGKSKFGNGLDSNKFHPDSLVVFVGNKYLIDFVKPFKAENDSIVRIQNWYAVDYLNPKSNFLYLQYKKDEFDEIYIEYVSNKKSCNGTNYANFAINRVYYNNIEIKAINSIYKITK